MEAVSAFATAAVVLVVLLVAASLVVSSMSTEAMRPVRMTGPAVRRWSGFVLLGVGGWFVLLAVLSKPVPGS